MFYAALAGCGWVAARCASVPFAWLPAWGAWQFFTAALAGVLAGDAFVRASQYASRRWSWARALRREMRTALVEFDRADALPLALASSLGEEILFRGFLQAWLAREVNPWFGLAVSSTAFGMVHVPWNRKLIPWTAMALLMGGAFGLLSTHFGLVASVIAHAWINTRNFRFLLQEPVAAAE